MTQKTRHSLYALFAALIALAVLYFQIGPDEAEAWHALLVAALGLVSSLLAERNSRSSDVEPPPRQDPIDRYGE